MKVIDPITVNNANFVSSSVPEDDHIVWNDATTYAIGQRVMTTDTHTVWQSAVNNNLNRNPNLDFTGQHWLKVGATRRWRAFDESVGARTTHLGVISYRIKIGTVVNAVAMLRLGAFRARVRVIDSTGATIYDRTRDLVDYTNIIDPLTMVTVQPDTTDFGAFENLAALPGHEMLIELGLAGSETSVGEIIIGRAFNLGRTQEDSDIGFTDYSKKDRDEFGNISIVKRPYSDNSTFEVAIPFENAKKAKKLLVQLRSRAALYYEDEADTYGLAVYGICKDVYIPLKSSGFSFASIEIEGLT